MICTQGQALEEKARDPHYVHMGDEDQSGNEEVIPADEDLAELADWGLIAIAGKEPGSCLVVLDSGRQKEDRALTLEQGRLSPALISLRFVTVVVRNPKNQKWTKVAGLLDDGSNVSLISEELRLKLGLTGETKPVTIGSLGGKTVEHESCHVNVMIEHVNQQIKLKAHLKSLPNPVGNLVMTDWNQLKKHWPHMASIPFNQLPESPKVHLLLGNDLNYVHRAVKEVHPPRGRPGPSARLTPMGWTATGVTVPGQAVHVGSELSHVSNAPLLNAEDRLAVKIVQEGLRQKKDGTYQVPVPWKGPERPGPNALDAMKDWLRQYQVLKTKPEAYKKLSAIIQGWEEKGYIRKVPVTEARPAGSFHLIHFPVIREDNATTKVRPVMNGKASFKGGCSLNDCLLTGPKVINDLSEVLWQFRQFQFAIGGDVQEMYLRIEMPEEDRPYHRFFFTLYGDDQVTEYEANVHQFGSASSPFIALFTVKVHARKKKEELPVASETVIKHSIVDDWLRSFIQQGWAVTAILQLIALFRSCNMNIHKWISNCPEILRQAGVSGPTGPKVVGEDLLDFQGGKALGLCWTPEDQLTFRWAMSLPSSWTKRTALSICNGLFDPHGYLLPFKMVGRMLFQEVCHLKGGWDEALPESIAVSWTKYWEEASVVSKITLPRWVKGEQANQLHVFADASGSAFACCAYLVGPGFSFLLGSKGHLVRSKTATINKSELEGLILAVGMASKLCGVFGLALDQVTFWTDSKTVLHWVKAPGRNMEVVVARRVAALREKIPAGQFRHVPTDQNPADLPSRGVKGKELEGLQLWWNGPEFLVTGEWPEQLVTAHPHVPLDGEEELEHLLTFLGTSEASGSDPFLNAGSFRQGLRVCQTMLIRMRRGEATPSEAFRAWRIFDQTLWFLQEKNKLRLRPVLDVQGVQLFLEEGELKMRGRAGHPGRPVLHAKSRLAYLWVLHCHEQELLHVGGFRTLAGHCRDSVWIWKGVSLFRRVVNHCVRCRRTFPQPRPQKMANLPPERYTPQPLAAFTHTSLDYAGPWHTVQGRGKTRTPRYLLLFCCLASRACALEMTYGDSTDDTLMALQCFASRYRLPSTIYSDNAAPLVAAGRLLTEVREGRQDLPINAAWMQVKWTFSHPRASHTNGITESLVKSAKMAIKKALMTATLRDGHLRCVFSFVEDILNHRPILTLNNDPGDLDTLTPAKLLGRTQGHLVPGPALQEELAQKWKETNALAVKFWLQFQKEIVPELEKAQKWWNVVPAPQVGDAVVILKLDPKHGPDWPVGVVREVHPGRDGLVRSATVEWKGKMYLRNLRHLMPLV